MIEQEFWFQSAGSADWWEEIRFLDRDVDMVGIVSGYVYGWQGTIFATVEEIGLLNGNKVEPHLVIDFKQDTQIVMKVKLLSHYPAKIYDLNQGCKFAEV